LRLSPDNEFCSSSSSIHKESDDLECHVNDIDYKQQAQLLQQQQQKNRLFSIVDQVLMQRKQQQYQQQNLVDHADVPFWLDDDAILD
jgi:hypothetical protein